MVVANAGVPPGGGVLQQQSPLVGAVVGTPGVGSAVAKSPYNQTAATAARVAAALAKSAQSVGQVQQQPRAQFYGHNPNMKCEYSGCWHALEYTCIINHFFFYVLWAIVSCSGVIEVYHNLENVDLCHNTRKNMLYEPRLSEVWLRVMASWWLKIMLNL